MNFFVDFAKSIWYITSAHRKKGVKTQSNITKNDKKLKKMKICC